MQFFFEPVPGIFFWVMSVVFTIIAVLATRALRKANDELAAFKASAQYMITGVSNRASQHLVASFRNDNEYRVMVDPSNAEDRPFIARYHISLVRKNKNTGHDEIAVRMTTEWEHASQQPKMLLTCNTPHGPTGTGFEILEFYKAMEILKIRANDLRYKPALQAQVQAQAQTQTQ